MVDFAKLNRKSADKKDAQLINTVENWSVKHRPRSLEELLGQKSTVREIRGMFKRKQMPSSWLISGSTGCGKTTLARIIAKLVNGFDPEKDGYSDIIETNAADERKIDDVRDMIASMRFMPQRGKYKVYIIDECHALTSQSASAILKALEEPHPHIIWILATNEPNKLLKTIQDRCYRISLKPLDEEHMQELLHSVANKEEVFTPTKKYKKLFRAIVRNADGTPRKALQILQKMANLCAGNEKLDEEEQMELLEEALESLDIEAEKVAAKLLLSLYQSHPADKIVEILGDTKNYADLTQQMLEFNTFLIENACGIKTWRSHMKTKLIEYMKDKGIHISVEKLMEIQTALYKLRINVTMAMFSERYVIMGGIGDVIAARKVK